MTCIAGNYGSGRRGGGVSTLVCAVFDDENPDQDEAKYDQSRIFRCFSEMFALPGTDHLCALGLVYRSKTMSGCAQNPGKHGTPNRHPVSYLLRTKALTIRETCSSILKSK